MNLEHWEKIITEKVAQLPGLEDPAHDFSHFRRVVRTAKKLCSEEKAKLEVVMPAAWLHDFVIVPKNDPRRKQASKLSALAAIEYLQAIKYPEQYFSEISHAIEAHSFSANLKAESIEAKIVQDADRLDGLGAIGIARCFSTAGILQRPYYSFEDPFCTLRKPNDSQFTIDHFYAKLFTIAKTMQTEAGKIEAQRRAERMRRYLQELESEIL